MKKNNISQTDKTIRSFLSLVDFKNAHSKLLQNYHEPGNLPEFFAEIQEFVQSGQKLGELLDASDDRWAAQTLLDYWATVLFRADYDAPDVVLAEFNLNLVPDLDSKLCPYLGLEAFQKEDQDKFFGRQRVVNELLENLQENQLLIVEGPSGSGKSSLIRAGLLPRLISGGLPGSENWKYYEPMVPGSNPLETLVATIHPRKNEREPWVKKQVDNLLESPNHLSRLVAELGLDVPIVFVIDQFEEIFTLCTEDTCRQAFVNNLLGLIQTPDYRHIVILTLRRDFITYLSQLPNLNQLFTSSAFPLMPLLPEELRNAIEEPANLIGLKYEDGIVDELVRDVQNDPAALPLLQFALLKLWDKKTRNRITWNAYQSLGGAHEALQKSANELYDKLSTEDQITTTYILVRLSRVSEKKQEVTRNRVQLKSLYEDGMANDRVDRVLAKFVDAHLIRITTGDTEEDTMVEIAHEALVRNWSKLVKWLDEDRDKIRQRSRLSEAAEQWDATGRDQSLLWRGWQLVDASNYKDLSPIEDEFVRASQLFIEEEQEREDTRRLELKTAEIKAESERENAEKLRNLVDEKNNALKQAQEERVRAEKQARLASSREIAASAMNSLNADPELSILLAMNAVMITDSVGESVTYEAENALHQAIQSSRVMLTLSGHTDQVRSVAFSPDGTYLASASQDHTIKIWDLTSGKELFTLLGHTDGVLDVAFSPNGEYLATASRDKTARLWHIQSRLVKHIFNHTKGIYKIAFSPDGMSLATASADETAKIWSIASGKTIQVLDEHTDEVNGVAFSPNGTRLITVSKDKTIKIWNPKTGELVYNLPKGHTEEVIDVVFRPNVHNEYLNNEYFVTTGQDDVKIWENCIPDRKMRFVLSHGSWVESVAFSVDGKYLATGSEDGTAKVWDFDDIGSRRELITLAGHSDRIYKVAFSPINPCLATAGRDGTIKIWDISSFRQEILAIKYESGINRVKFSPSGEILATSNFDKTATLWNLKSGHSISLLGHSQMVNSIAFSPDGQRLATASEDKKIIIWDVNSGDDLHSLPTHADSVLDVSFSPDGKFLGTACRDGVAKIWDATSYDLLYEIKHGEGILGITFSQTGYIATGGRDNMIKIWNSGSGQQLRDLHNHISWVTSVAFNPDGTRLVTCSYDKTAKIFDYLNGQVLHTLLGHTNYIFDVSFSADGKHIATASADKTVKIWDAESGQEVLTFSNHTDEVKSVAFSPDGKYLASTDQSGVIRIYVLPVKDLLMLAQERVTRSLRPNECVKYLRLNEWIPIISAVDNSRLTDTALWLIVRGRNLARGGDVDEAIACFQNAKKLVPQIVGFDLQKESMRLYEIGKSGNEQDASAIHP